MRNSRSKRLVPIAEKIAERSVRSGNNYAVMITAVGHSCEIRIGGPKWHRCETAVKAAMHPEDYQVSGAHDCAVYALAREPRGLWKRLVAIVQG